MPAGWGGAIPNLRLWKTDDPHGAGRLDIETSVTARRGMGSSPVSGSRNPEYQGEKLSQNAPRAEAVREQREGKAKAPCAREGEVTYSSHPGTRIYLNTMLLLEWEHNELFLLKSSETAVAVSWVVS